MSKVVLHIGTHKTATTTIQNVFWGNYNILAEHGLIYPRISDIIPGHHGLVFYWKHMPVAYRLPQGSRAALQDIVNTYADKDVTVFLSSEEFSRVGVGDQQENSFVELRKILCKFDEIEVICVLRPQWQFLQSTYLEMSKKRNPKRPPTLVNPVIKSGAAGLWVDYNRLLSLLEEAFAPSEITFFDFATCHRSQGGILGHFLSHLDVDIKAVLVENGDDIVFNASSLSLAGWAANILSEPHPAPPHLVCRIEKALREKFGVDVRPCIFTHDEFRRLREHFEPKNRMLEARRATVQPDFVMSKASPDEATLFRDDINKAFWIEL